MTQKLILRHGDCVEVLKGYEDGSIGALVSDPPYGLKFMGMGWDALDGRGKHGATEVDRSRSFDCVGGNHNPTSAPDAARTRRVENQKQQRWHLQWLIEVYRVLRPGGVIKAFSGTRTYHRMAAAMAEAGFTDLRIESWNYGSGFPKSLNIGKALDKRPGAIGHYLEIKRFLSDAIKASPKTRSQVDTECGFSACDFARTTGSSPFVNVIPDARKWGIMRGVLGFDSRWDKAVEAAERTVVGTGMSGTTAIWHSDGGVGKFDITAPATEAAHQWDGWGTALKPSWEPVILGRKPA